MLANNFFENVPNDRLLALDQFACLFDGGGVGVLFQLIVNKRLEQLQSHFLWQTALVQFEFRADHDNRTSGIIDTLSEQVLTKASLLAFQCTGQRFQRAIIRTSKHAAAAAVVEQSI